jgi:hypothetical protein
MGARPVPNEVVAQVPTSGILANVATVLNKLIKPMLLNWQETLTYSRSEKLLGDVVLARDLCRVKWHRFIVFVCCLYRANCGTYSLHTGKPWLGDCQC